MEGIRSSTLPGLQESDWRTLTIPRFRTSFEDWAASPLQGKISQENQAVRALLERKDPAYVTELRRWADSLKPMSNGQRVGIVMPAYNEQDSIVQSLQGIANRSIEGGVDPRHWGVTVVVNRPLVEDQVRDAQDSLNLRLTVERIQGLQVRYPELDINYIVVEAPRSKAGVGLARMVGHDLAALRSLLRPAEQRETPYYIQTADADMPGLYPNYLSLILQRLDADRYAMDFYRETARSPLEDMRKCPLLHCMDFMWTDTIREISKRTDSAWTAGAGILVSLNAHASAGGVFPFRLRRGVDEDLRIGIHARLMRGGSNQGQADITEPLFETDPRRMVLVIGDLLETMKERGLDARNGVPLTRELHDIATLLRSYLDFHDTQIRGQRSPTFTDLSWLDSNQAFQAAVPIGAIEIIANSYIGLIRVELSLDLAKRISPYAANVYEVFTQGGRAYPMTRGAYNSLELKLDELYRTTGDPRGQVIAERSVGIARDAADAMAGILRSHGMTCEISYDTSGTPPPMQAQARLPSPIKITSSSGYLAELRGLLS